MSATRVFDGLDAFARFLEERPLVIIPTGQLVVAKSAKILEKYVRAGYGSHSLAELAQATQDDRVSKGYSPDDPLLRDGALLRDSTQSEVGFDFAAVHTDEPIAGYQEFGYFNVRANKDVVARPVYKEALEKAIPVIEELIEEALGIQLGFGVTLSSDIETRTARYDVDT